MSAKNKAMKASKEKAEKVSAKNKATKASTKKAENVSVKKKAMKGMKASPRSFKAMRGALARGAQLQGDEVDWCVGKGGLAANSVEE